jgi:DNA polymerase-3 subunit epsilon
MQISLESREFHGALLDAQLLAKVYLELNGGRERALDLSFAGENKETDEINWTQRKSREQPLPSRLNASAQAAHERFLGELGKDVVWDKFLKR